MRQACVLLARGAVDGILRAVPDELSTATELPARQKNAWLIPTLVGASLRLAAFPAAENVWGDSPVRGDLARAWAGAPGLWWDYARSFQFGPLPLHLGGLLVLLGGGDTAGPRLLSLLCGVASVGLLAHVATRLGGPRAGLAAGLALALSPLHLQASTTFASEAPFVFFALLAAERTLAGAPLGCALAAFAATTTRFDAWLWLPFLAGWRVLRARGRDAGEVRRSWAAAVLLLAGPASILLANALTSGDPLAPLHHVAQEHVGLGRAEEEARGVLAWRLRTLLFWPLAWVVTLTPGFAWFAARGLVAAVRARSRSAPAAALGLVGPAAYALRAALFGTFWPMTRFLLPAAAQALVAQPPLRRPELAACVVIALLFNAGLVLWEGWEGPRSPVSRLPDDLRRGVEVLRRTERAVLDVSPRYEQIVIAHHAGRDHWRLRWEPGQPLPELVVAVRGGELEGQLRTEGGRLFGCAWEEAGGEGRISWWRPVPGSGSGAAP